MMTTPTTMPIASATAGQAWTCPFCSLLCDSLAVAMEPHPRLVGSRCPTALRALARMKPDAASATPMIDGKPADYESALAAAADILGQSRQPLFGGLATDVAGARSLYRLADACAAILDHVRGEALMTNLRALQDRGAFMTTLAEIRNRADLIVCIGTNPAENYPDFFRRCAPVGEAAKQRQVVYLGAPAGAVPEEGGGEEMALSGDLFDTVSSLAARLAGRRIAADPTLDGLVQRMQAATYTVLVWEPARLPAQGALIAETIQRLANMLNRTTRAATFCLGGSDGGVTANQTVAWLSGLPLRTGIHARGLAHEPLRYATDRLLAGKAVDVLLWVASFDPTQLPPKTELPRVVLGHPDLAAALEAGRDTVFIPVSTPGIGSAGHLFRTDGVVVVPLDTLYADGLPSVARVAADLADRLPARGEKQ